MGTTYTVKVVTSPLREERTHAVERLIQDQLDDVDSKMSTYKPESELSRFNRLHATTPFSVSRDTLEVFRVAHEVSVLSGGAFDVTVAPLVNVWGFGPEPAPEHVPSEERIAALRRHVGFAKVEISPETSTLRKLDPLVTCDLSAIASGYGVDRVATALERDGLDRYLIEVGGEVRAAGLSETDEPWRLGIERPDGKAFVRTVPLLNRSLATSGNYRNFEEIDGRRFSHTIDPGTGRPVTHGLASVTVTEKLCVRADALAAALSALGPERGYELAVREELSALFLVRGEPDAVRERATPAFERSFPRPR